MLERPFVSIIIPTYNESDAIESLLDSLCVYTEEEVVVVDGGSTDGTDEIIMSLSAKYSQLVFTQAQRGRSLQMNAGAAVARGRWLIFLHADTLLPQASLKAFIEYVKSNPETIGGAFTFRVAHSKAVYRYLEWYVAQRCRFLKLPFGDQAIFVRKDVFGKLGGYRSDYPLMEDMEFVQRLNKYDGFAVVQAPVYTSARRFERDGYFRRTLGNLYLQVLYSCGVHPQQLAQRYYGYHAQPLSQSVPTHNRAARGQTST